MTRYIIFLTFTSGHYLATMNTKRSFLISIIFLEKEEGNKIIAITGDILQEKDRLKPENYYAL